MKGHKLEIYSRIPTYLSPGPKSELHFSSFWSHPSFPSPHISGRNIQTAFVHKCFPCIISAYLYSFSYRIRNLLGDICWSSFFPAVPIRLFPFTMKIEQMGCITASLAQLVGSPKKQFIGAMEDRKAKLQSIKLYTAIGGYKSFLQMTPLYSPKRVHQCIALKCLKSQRHLKTNKQMDKQHFSFLVSPFPFKCLPSSPPTKGTWSE